MSVIVGIAGAARNAAAALCDGGRIVAVCEQERVTRTRRAGLLPGQLPTAAIDAVLALGNRTLADVDAYAVAEDAIVIPPTLRVERLDHHRAHAATAWRTSSLASAAVVVCDRHGAPEFSAWRAGEQGLRPVDLGWAGPSFASAYSRIAAALSLAADGDEHRVEALALVADGPAHVPERLITCDDGHLDVSPQLESTVSAGLLDASSADPLMAAARWARGLQELLGVRLLETVASVRNKVGEDHLCLGGGLFFNSYFTTLIARSGLFKRIFVPVNPGNAGVAVGAALEVASSHGAATGNLLLSPFLGPSYAPSAIKATLDNCKLSYDYGHDGHAVERAVEAVASGKLVGWFQDRMEWGARALGNRSILASPVAPFVLENVNVFLKQREPHRSYSVSICEEDLPQYFHGPETSRFMEYEYEVREPAMFRSLLPMRAARLRVQTVPATASPFHSLLKAVGVRTGVPAVLNTSFNGFNEPIVCSPRDAVRVFYGTGLDAAVLGNFVIQK
jgi:carbamoyltransferase